MIAFTFSFPDMVKVLTMQGQMFDRTESNV